MEKLLHSIARRFWPELLEASGRDRAVGFSDILAVLYAGPLSVVALVWLVGVTDLSVLRVAWLPFAGAMLLIYAFRRLDFNFYIQIDRGLFGSVGGSLDDIVRWFTALLFGPTALWLFLVWRSVSLAQDLRRSDTTALRWRAARSCAIDAGGDTLAGLVALAVYVSVGGVHPPTALSLSALTPAIYATIVRFLLPIVVSIPYMLYIERSPVLGFAAESRRAVRKLTWMSVSWPLLIAPFTVFAAGLYAEKGFIAPLFVVVGALMASALAHRMSSAVEQSRERTRELRSLEGFGRAIVGGPRDGSKLPEFLREHVGEMFAMCTIDVRLFPRRELLHEPDYVDRPDEVVWEWLQATGETLGSPARRELPWGVTPRSHGLVLVPIVHSETGAVLGGIAIKKRVNPETVSDIIPAAQSLAAQIASVLHGAEVYEQTLRAMRAEEELAVAAEMQASLMPSSAPHVPGWEFKAIIDSAREASGDFIDLIPLSEDRWGILVADVSGKGVAAALYMAMVRTLIRTYAFEHESAPAAVMSAANRRILSDTDDDSFVTVFYAVLDPKTGTLQYCNAGHNPPYLFRTQNGGAVEELRGTGIPLGMLKDAVWEGGEVTMLPGDRLLAYTDGATDAQNPDDEPFGEGRLLEVAKANVKATPIEMRTAVFDEIKSFVGEAPQEDDITLMVVARDGA
jgi:serine phosphatase RsbU (regulator of sigma subunit)